MDAEREAAIAEYRKKFKEHRETDAKYVSLFKDLFCVRNGFMVVFVFLD